MKKNIIITIFLILSLAIIVYIIPKNNSNINSEETKDNNEEKVTTKEKDIVKETLENMTLEEKIGQMIIISSNDTYMSEELLSTLKTYKPGGYLLFADNLTDYSNTLQFINDIKSTNEIPMFISIDQEGGLVQRLKQIDGASIIPSMEDVGKTNDTEYAKNVGKVIGEELKVFGINIDFAPVIDIQTEESFIGSRSFGSDKDLVSKMGLSLANGIKSTGVIPVFKHFPGHGATTTDSHYDLPVIYKTKEELLNSDLIPFKNAINHNAEIIMIGHIALPLIDETGSPASLSKVIITDLLKNELNYKGLVITDALMMKALTNNYSEKEIYEKAINAGTNILLRPTSIESAINLISESINEGTIDIELINSSVSKILEMKYKKLDTKTLPENYLGSEEHKKLLTY